MTFKTYFLCRVFLNYAAVLLHLGLGGLTLWDSRRGPGLSWANAMCGLSPSSPCFRLSTDPSATFCPQLINLDFKIGKSTESSIYLFWFVLHLL